VEEEMMLDLNLIAYTTAVGIIYASLGYLKNRRDFELRKFLRTVGVGALVGVIAPFFGLDLASFDFEKVATTGGLIFFIQTLLQILVSKGERR
jgi:multisubunit Na+/H+ antiporter MnhB subunit